MNICGQISETGTVIEQGQWERSGGRSMHALGPAYDQDEFVTLMGPESTRSSRHDLRLVVAALQAMAGRCRRGGARQMNAEFNGGKERQFEVAVCHSGRALQGQAVPLGTRLGGVCALPGRALAGVRH